VVVDTIISIEPSKGQIVRVDRGRRGKGIMLISTTLSTGQKTVVILVNREGQLTITAIVSRTF
jgi:hypothetical protein